MARTIKEIADDAAKKLAAAANKTRARTVCLVDETKIEGLRDALEYERQRRRARQDAGHFRDLLWGS